MSTVCCSFAVSCANLQFVVAYIYSFVVHGLNCSMSRVCCACLSLSLCMSTVCCSLSRQCVVRVYSLFLCMSTVVFVRVYSLL